MVNRRGFDFVVLVGLLMHAAVALPRMWARKEMVANQSGAKNLVGRAVLSVTS